MTPKQAKSIAWKIALRIMDRIYMARPTISRPGVLPLLRSDIEEDAFAVITGGIGVNVEEDVIHTLLPPQRAPDWEDLYQRYWTIRECNCPSGNPPCSYCVDGWEDSIDWDHERLTTGYVLELDGKR